MPEIYLVVSIAGLFDLVNWIPFVNWVIELVAVIGFGIYVWVRGLKAWANIAGRLVEVAIESWPLVSILPGTMLGVATTFTIIAVLRKLATSALAQTAAKAAFGAAGAAAVEGAKALAGKEEAPPA